MKREKEEWNLISRWQNAHRQPHCQQWLNLQHRKKETKHVSHTDWHISLSSQSKTWSTLCGSDCWNVHLTLEFINTYMRLFVFWVKFDYGRVCDVISVVSIWEEMVSPRSERSGVPKLHLFRMTKNSLCFLSLFIPFPSFLESCSLSLSLFFWITIPHFIMSSMHPTPTL